MKNMETRLYELRKKTGMSQDELAEKIGVSRQTISKWERGEALPDTENLIALAKLYNVTLDDIVNYNEDEEKPEEVKFEIIDASETINKEIGEDEEKEVENKISSPYTKIKHSKYDLAPIVLVIAVLLFISLIVYLVLKIVTEEPKISKELSGGIYYELTQ